MISNTQLESYKSKHIHVYSITNASTVKLPTVKQTFNNITGVLQATFINDFSILLFFLTTLFFKY